MENLITVLKAAEAAASWHAGQKRKGKAQEPYINHLIEVAGLVAGATQGNDPDLVVAALLHDAIEDRGVNAAMLAERFGPVVTSLVLEVTDDKSLKKQERKRLQVETAPFKSDKAKMLKLADKTSNLRALATSPPNDWRTDRLLGYVTWARQVAAGLRGVSPWLEERFDDAARNAEDVTTGNSHPQTFLISGQRDKKLQGKRSVTSFGTKCCLFR